MTTYNHEQTTAPETDKTEYNYQEYQPVTEYKSAKYWTTTYEDVQEKYSGEDYAQKQYIANKEKEAYGQETADYLIANKKDNVIETYDGNDVVEAGYGNDKIDVGKGDDWLWGMSKEHDASKEKYSQAEYTEVDWFTAGEDKDVYALGTEKYAHYATNDSKDYAIITDYTAEDTVMLHGTAENYVVGKSVAMYDDKTTADDQAMMQKTATLYWDKDENGSYSEGDDMVAVFEGYSADEITVAKDSWLYVTAESTVT